MFAKPYSRYIFYPVPWYSFLIVTGVVIAVILASREEKRLGLKKDTILDLALWLLPCGIIGARIYYVIFSWDLFKDDLLSVLRIWEGGIAIYGAVIAGLIVVFVFSRRRRLSPLLLCDIIAPGLILAQGIGRWGNYFNMEAYGLPVVNPSLQFFPFAVLIPESSGDVWHLATFFYESLWDLSVFAILYFVVRKRLKRTGDLFFSYVFLYGAGRLVIEDLRTDSLYLSSGIRVSQLLSVLALVLILGRRVLNCTKEGSLPKGLRFLFLPLAILYSILAFLMTVSVSFLSSLPLKFRCLILAGYAAYMILCFFLSYGFSDLKEDTSCRQPD